MREKILQYVQITEFMEDRTMKNFSTFGWAFQEKWYRVKEVKRYIHLKSFSDIPFRKNSLLNLKNL
jgi:hypothetical protein